ncbi:hypothetical protein CK203_068917 [Vitis vinifera]|uniref:Uncharacterized protein n=1 Tax=Vitis vinifera TaxID=29760 RepID=A0A438F190_VITVI|nr:hypothetical protein CK203_068917 [Vitis vinifera]
MERRLEKLEMNQMQEVQAISQTPLQAMPCAISGETIQIFLGNQGLPPYQPQAQTQAPQQTSSVEQAIVNLSKVMGDFVGEQKEINSQLHQKIENVESSQIKRMDEVQNDLSQKIDNLQDSISRFANLNTMQEKENSPSQPHQNQKGIHEMELRREIKRLICPHAS